MVNYTQRIIWQFSTVMSSSLFAAVCKPGLVELKKNKCPSASGGFEGIGGCVVEAGIGEDGQGAHGGEDDEDPEKHAVHHHGHVLPVLLQLYEDGRMKGRIDRMGEREGGVGSH